MYFFYLLIFTLFTSCTSLKKEKEVSSKLGNIDPQDLTLFESAFEDLGNEEYASVIPIFKNLAEKYRGQDLEWAALYNLASAHKEVGQCKEAENIYQRLLAKKGTLPHLKARIYLSLSYVYECLGQAEKTLIALKEGEKYINYLTEDIRFIEYPARLSMAYIRMDEDKTGLKIQKKVYQNMEMMKKVYRINSAADENFARYFYIVGRSHVHSDHIQLRRFLKMLFYHQVYLTQSLLLEAGDGSVKAEKELGDLYCKMWSKLKRQKNKKTYQIQVTKILNQLKDISINSKSKKMRAIYTGLRKKTLFYMGQGPH
ncbi:MAG: hypothetical protein OXM55_00210 [Bdellovibrionales bacterium]|nr:hypothetical protein [Bdellovibrionales bacterium]